MRLLSEALLSLAVTYLMFQTTAAESCEKKIWRVAFDSIKFCESDETLIKINDVEMKKEGRYKAIFAANVQVYEDISSELTMQVDIDSETAAGTKAKVLSKTIDMCNNSKEEDAGGSGEDDDNQQNKDKAEKRKKEEEANQKLIKPLEIGSNLTLSCPITKGYYEFREVTYDIWSVYEGKLKAGQYIINIKIVNGERVALCMEISGEIRIEAKTFDDC